MFDIFRQCSENKSFAAKYFAAKSLHVGDLSMVFPKKQNNNETYMKEKYSVFDDNKENHESNNFSSYVNYQLNFLNGY